MECVIKLVREHESASNSFSEQQLGFCPTKSLRMQGIKIVGFRFRLHVYLSQFNNEINTAQCSNNKIQSVATNIFDKYVLPTVISFVLGYIY